MEEIFIAYRQSDAKAWAVAVRDTLVEAFGVEAVFLDRDTLEAGSWSAQLEQAISRCRVLIVVIGPAWLRAGAANGAARLAQADDVHRREIEQGLAQSGTTVLPLLVDGAGMPLPSALPPSLAALADRQALEWGDSARHRAVDRERLLATLERHTGFRARRSQRRGAIAPVAVALLLTLLLATLFSTASMGLSGTELAVLLVLALGLSHGVQALWRQRPGA